MYIHIYIYIYVHVYVYIYIYIHIYIYLHLSIPLSPSPSLHPTHVLVRTHACRRTCSSDCFTLVHRCALNHVTAPVYAVRHKPTYA